MKPNRYCILLTQHCHDMNIAQEALHFCQYLLEHQQPIDCLFLYQDAVYLAQRSTVVADGAFNINRAWSALLTQHKLIGKACVNSALRRGIVDETYAKLENLSPQTIAPGFELAGIGVFFESLQQSHQFIQF